MLRFLLALLTCLALAPVSMATPGEDAVRVAYQDAQTIPDGTRQHCRWLHLPWQAAEKKLFWWRVVAGHINALSRESLIVAPAIVFADGESRLAAQVRPADWGKVALVRINLLDYRIDPRIWDKLAEQDPHFHILLQQEEQEIPYEVNMGVDGKTPYLREPGGEWVLEKNWTKGKTFKKTRGQVVALAPWLVETKDGTEALLGLLALLRVPGYTPSTPVLRADNFFWQTASQFDRKVGYYGLLEIKDEKSFERLVGFDRKANVDPAYLDTISAVVQGEGQPNGSGVAREPRRIEFYTRTGAGVYTRTLDNEIAKDEHDPVLFPNGGFRYKAVEAFGNSPSGMFLVGLFVGNDPGQGQKEGQIQDSAPDFVGHDKTARYNDAKIHIYISCFRCHDDGGLQGFSDYFRDLHFIGKGLQSPARAKIGTLREYARPYEPALRHGRDVYTQALLQANGLSPREHARALALAYDEYNAPVGLDRAAFDLGYTVAQLQEKLQATDRASGSVDANSVLATFLRPEKPLRMITLNQYFNNYNQLQLEIRGIRSWPAAIRSRVQLK